MDLIFPISQYVYSPTRNCRGIIFLGGGEGGGSTNFIKSWFGGWGWGGEV